MDKMKNGNDKNNGSNKEKWISPTLMTIYNEYMKKHIKVAARSGGIACSTEDTR